MSSAQHRANRPKITTFQLVAGVSFVIGLVASSLVLVILFNAAPESSQSSLSNASLSSSPNSAPTDQALLADTDEPSVSTGAETPAATPSSTPNTTESTVEPTPESDSATFAEETSRATATPESQRSNSPAQEASESGATDSDVSSVSSAPTMQLKIPSIGVDAPVEVKSVDSAGVMEDPSSPDSVAWYDFTSRPEDGGNAVFAGHLDYAGVGPAVFWDLGSVTNGDEVQVAHPDGGVITYRITSVRSVHADTDASDIVASSDVPKITIITCDGSFDPSSQEYDQRIVVTGERVR